MRVVCAGRVWVRADGGGCLRIGGLCVWVVVGGGGGGAGWRRGFSGMGWERRGPRVEIGEAVAVALALEQGEVATDRVDVERAAHGRHRS